MKLSESTQSNIILALAAVIVVAILLHYNGLKSRCLNQGDLDACSQCARYEPACMRKGFGK